MNYEALWKEAKDSRYQVDNYQDTIILWLKALINY